MSTSHSPEKETSRLKIDRVQNTTEEKIISANLQASQSINLSENILVLKNFSSQTTSYVSITQFRAIMTLYFFSTEKLGPRETIWDELAIFAHVVRYKFPGMSSRSLKKSSRGTYREHVPRVIAPGRPESRPPTARSRFPEWKLIVRHVVIRHRDLYWNLEYS